MQTRDQKLAFAIYERMDERLQLNDKDRKAYGSMAHKLPILIRTAGLAQSLAFIEARYRKQDNTPTTPQLYLLRDLEDVLRKQHMLEGSNLFGVARQAQIGEYMRLTQHTLAALLWFKRYAQSVLGVEQGEEQEETTND